MDRKRQSYPHAFCPQETWPQLAVTDAEGGTISESLPSGEKSIDDVLKTLDWLLVTFTCAPVKNDKTRFLITNSGTEKHTLLFKIKSIRSLELKRIWNGHNVEVNGVSNMLLLLKSPWLRAANNIGAMFGIFFQRTTLCCSIVRNVTAGLACGTVWGPVYKKCISKTMANILNIGNPGKSKKGNPWKL